MGGGRRRSRCGWERTVDDAPVALSASGDLVAVTGPTGHALWRRTDHRTDRRTDHHATVYETGAWSSVAHWADNERLAVASGRRALVIGPDGGELWSTEPAPSTVTDLAWMRGGRRLAVAAYGAVRCHETITALAWRPGAAGHLASGGDNGTVALWRANSGRPEARQRPARTLDNDEPVAALAWSGPHLLVVAHHDGRVRACRLPSRNAL